MSDSPLSPARILDQYGQPMSPSRRQALGDEISAVGAINGRPPFEGHLAFGMDPGRLGAIIRAADGGNTREWMILAEEIEETFPHYSAALAKRKRQVAQLPITVREATSEDGEHKRHADFVREWLATDVLQRSLFDMLDALGKAYSVHEIMWETKPGRFRPCELIYRPQRFFELSWRDGATVWLRDGAGFLDLAPHKFLVHTHRSKSGLIARSGLTRMVCFLWLYASYTAKDWGLFVQAYGMPIRVGKYGPSASVEDKRVLWRAVSSIAGDVAAIIPDSMQMEFVKDQNREAGRELFGNRADWLNREVSKLVLGGTAGMEAIAGGHAVGREHRAGEQDVEKFDADRLTWTIAPQLVRPMIDFTFGPQDAYPTLVIGRPDEVPLRDVVDAVADLGPLGFKVRKSDLYDRLQLTPPEAGDDVIGGVPATVKPPPIELPMPGGNAELGTARGATFLGRLITRHAEAPPEVVDQLTERLAADAAGALHGLTEQVRHAMTGAKDLADLVERVRVLQLKPAAFAEAMARGMALANLVGQASLLDELHARRS